MIDTIELCGNSKSDRVEETDADFVPQNKKDSNDQWDWIHDQMKDSDADYLFVVGHFPVYTVGSHGPTKCLIEQLLPMLFKYEASAYISGHDHCLQVYQVAN